MMNLTQLETFRRLALEGNFTRTAELLDLTQPAVTQHVRGLQDHFHVKLVDLVGRKTVMTDAGRFLAARAEVLLGNVEALEREMREFADVRAGELRIGASVTIGTYQLPAIIARFRSAYPEIRLRVEVANTEAIARMVARGHVSIALVEGPLESDEFDISTYCDDELVLVAPPDHELCNSITPIALEAVARTPLVFREDGSGTRVQVESAFDAVGLTPNVVLTLPSGEAIVRAVEVGLGVAIVSRRAVEDAVAAGRLAVVPMADATFARTFRIMRLSRQTPSPSSLAFASLLKSTTF